MSERNITQKMLKTIHNNGVIVEAAQKDDKIEKFEINKDTPQFGDVREDQEKNLKKTIEEDIDVSLIYYPSLKDLVLNGKISSLNVAFQYRYKDSSGDGCYIWANELQLTDTNSRKLGKIRDAFLNWRKNLLENDDLLDKMHKASSKNNKD